MVKHKICVKGQKKRFERTYGTEKEIVHGKRKRRHRGQIGAIDGESTEEHVDGKMVFAIIR